MTSLGDCANRALGIRIWPLASESGPKPGGIWLYYLDVHIDTRGCELHNVRSSHHSLDKRNRPGTHCHVRPSQQNVETRQLVLLLPTATTATSTLTPKQPRPTTPLLCTEPTRTMAQRLCNTPCTVPQIKYDESRRREHAQRVDGVVTDSGESAGLQKGSFGAATARRQESAECVGGDTWYACGFGEGGGMGAGGARCGGCGA